MDRKMKKVLIVAFVAILTLISCGKKGDPYPKKPSLKSVNLIKITGEFFKNG